MIKLYGNIHWGGCEPVKELLLQSGIQFEYVEMTESIKNLKEYLKLRDFRDEFTSIKDNNKLGVPVLLYKDQLYFQDEIDEKLVEKMKADK